MNHLFTLLGMCFLFQSGVFAQPDVRTYLADPKAGAREKNFDTEYLLLEVSFEPQKGLVKGKATLTFTVLQKEADTLFLDAPGINFKSVQLDGDSVEHSINPSGIIIKPSAALKWDSKHTLTIEYDAQPQKGIYFIGWNDTLNLSRKQIWTQGQGTDNRYWIPCFDDMNDKLISEVKVTFDKNYRVLSNGTLVSEKASSDGNKLWHYKMSHPHAPYLMMLGIGKYEVKKYKSKSGVPVELWYYPEYPERIEPTYRYSMEMMDWMEKEFGVPYPWEKYSQIPVQDFMFGAMENTTATVFGDFYVIDSNAYLDRYYIGTNAHELTHQWFGDYVTAVSAEGTWLQESFATHFAKHFERSVFGEDHYRWNKREELQRVLEASKRDNNPIVHTNAGSERVYQKGSLVLDMLKYVIGDEQYNRAQTYYLKKHPYGNIDTHDFYRAFLETLGINLDWFFNQWLYRGGEPSYKVDFEELADSTGKKFSRFTVAQTQAASELVGLFKMPVWLEVYYTDGSSDKKQPWISGQTHIIDIPNPQGKKVDYALFDPNSEIVKNVDFKKSFDMLQSQALKAQNMIDRYDALTALGTYPYDKKKEILKKAFKQEKFYAPRAEIAKQVAGLPEPDSEFMKEILNDKSSKVKLAAVQSIEKIPSELLTDFERLLGDSSYQVMENSLEKLSNDYPENIAKYLSATEGMIGMGNSVKIKRLEIGCRLDKGKYLPQLVVLASRSYEFRTRVNAMEALKRLNHLDAQLTGYLFDASLNPNRRLATPAKALLKHFMIQTEYRKLVERCFADVEWDDKQLGVLSELF